MKLKIFSTCMFAAMNAFADITVSDVKAFQGFPWEQGRVVVTYKITGTCDNPLFIRLLARDNITGREYDCLTLEGASVTEGMHKLTWDAKADGITLKSDSVAFVVQLIERNYCVVDLTTLDGLSKFPVHYMDELEGDVSSSEYKTTHILLKKVHAGSFKMNGTYNVRLSEDFYVGVYEVTIGQWNSVTGESKGTLGGKGDGYDYPVQSVSYDQIRGTREGAAWPMSDAVDENSFVGLLRKKTNLNFDLPTEAQWEYSCRAGTITEYNHVDADVGQPYRSFGNLAWANGYNDNPGVVAVGSGYFRRYVSYANSWGLWDFHGNVAEWTRDWYGELADGVDPYGVLDGTERVIRGGCAFCTPETATSSFRAKATPASTTSGIIIYNFYGWKSHDCRLGFRICLYK